MSRFTYKVSIMNLLPIWLNACTPESGSAFGPSVLVAGNKKDAWRSEYVRGGLAQYWLTLTRLLKGNGLK